MKNSKTIKGFTLIELLIVIAICFIVASIISGGLKEDVSNEESTHERCLEIAKTIPYGYKDFTVLNVGCLITLPSGEVEYMNELFNR